MATPKFATVRAVEMIGPDTRRIELEMKEQDLGFVGGQYVIMDSRLTLPNGKPAKRAYSIVSPDREQRSLTLVVKRVGEGLCSNYLHSVKVGDELRFSGPWGKFKIVDDVPEGELLIVATDSGITAALGFLSAGAMADALQRCHLLWMRDEQELFDPAHLATWRPPGLASLDVQVLAPVGHPERWEVARGYIDAARKKHEPSHVFMAGDGEILLPYAEILNRDGIETPKERVECFFNMPKKSG